MSKGKISYEEFLAWLDEDTWAEWVDGEVVMVSPASERHEDIGDFLISLVGNRISCSKENGYGGNRILKVHPSLELQRGHR